MKPFTTPVAGCMRWGIWGAGFNTNEFLRIINECVEHGITSFDHADIYGDYTTESDFGDALKASPSLRQQIQLITKCGIQLVTPNRSHHNIKSYNTSKEHIVESAENSLRNFHTDYIDLFLIHRPDPLMNPEEVAEAIARLKQQGKILHFGVSNFCLTRLVFCKNICRLNTTSWKYPFFTWHPLQMANWTIVFKTI